MATDYPITNADLEANGLSDGGWIRGASGWSFDGSGGVWNPRSYNFDEPAPSGEQIGYVSSGSASQVLNIAYDSTKTYDIDLALGGRNGQDGSDYEVVLMAGDTVIGSISGKVAGEGAWEDVTLSVPSGVAPIEDGQPLTLVIKKLSGYQLNFDDVSVTVEKPIVTDGATFQAMNHNSDVIMAAHGINYGLWLNNIDPSGARTVFDFEDPRSEVFVSIEGDMVTVQGVSVALTQQPDGSYAEEGIFRLDYKYSNVTQFDGDNDLYVDPQFDGMQVGSVSRLDEDGNVVETFDYTNKSGRFGGVEHSLRLGDGFNDQGGPWDKPGLSVDAWFSDGSGRHLGDFHFTLGQEFGTVSGRYFRDTDGNDVESDCIALGELADGASYTIEAEDMHLGGGYGVVGRSFTSGGQFIQTTSSGTAETVFDGETGVYRFDLTVFDETDGVSTIKVLVNGVEVGTFLLDDPNANATAGLDAATLKTVTVDALKLAAGDVITLEGARGNGEYARIDKIDLTQLDAAQYLIEAEDMDLGGGYGVVGRSFTSGGQFIQTTSSGTAETVFDGEAGLYQFDLTVFDETDGVSTIKVLVNGVEVGSFLLDDPNAGATAGLDAATLKTVTLDDVMLEAGDVITLEGARGQGEYARIDKIELWQTKAADPSVAGKTVLLLKDGVVIDSTTTDADGEYFFDKVEVGDGYQVAFEDSADRLENFVLPNAGDDDTIDSDVVFDDQDLGGRFDGDFGTTAVFSVSGNVTDVDAGTVDAIIKEECTVQLLNHPKGAAAEPFYGLRMDNVFDAGVYTFDFEADGVAMFATIDPEGGTVRIHGTALGGVDTGTERVNEEKFEIDFTYYGLTHRFGDNDLAMDASREGKSFGEIRRLDADGNVVETRTLEDKAGSFPFSFRFGDEDNDNGHRGVDAKSGWGWLKVDGVDEPGAQDWLFTVGEKVELNAKDDCIVVTESEGAGDIETLETGKTSILANDTDGSGAYAGDVVTVNGERGNVGDWIDLDKGRIKINADGTVDFDAASDFEDLNDGDVETVSINYTIGSLPTGNLIVNGDFETHGELTRLSGLVNGERDPWNTFDSIEGWTTPIGVLEIQDGTHVGTPFNTDGNSVLELDSDDSTDTNAAVEQVVEVEHAGTYTLAFDYSPRKLGNEVGATSEVNVFVNGVNIGSVSSDELGYERVTFEFDLPEGPATIGFAGGGLDDTYGALIDNVALTGVYVVDAIVTVKVEGQNDLADEGEAVTVNEDSGLTVLPNVLDNTTDPEAGDPIVVNVGTPSNGGVFVINPDGSATFDTNGEFEALAVGETATTTIEYTVEDAAGDQVTSTVTVTVEGVNDLADEDETATVGEDDGLVTLTNVLDNTTDPEAGDPTVVAVGTASNGGVFSIGTDGETTFDTNGEFEALAEGETAITSVEYTVEDAAGDQVNSTVTVTVEGVNDLEDEDECEIVSEDAGLTVLTNALDNTFDPEAGDPVINAIVDGGVVSEDAVGQPVAGSNGGLFVIEADGSVSFDPNGEFEFLGNGESTTTEVIYCVMDDAGEVVESFYKVIVEGVNDLADEGESLTVTEDAGLVPLPNVLDNTFDPEAGDPTVVDVGTPTNGGVFTINPDGSATFDTNGEFEFLGSGESTVTSVTYTVEDAAGDQVTSTVEIIVKGFNDLADESETATVGEDAGLVALDNVLDNTTDPEAGDPVVVNVGTASNGGVFSIAPDGTATFDTNGEFDFLAEGETAITSVTYTVEDAAGDQVTSTVTVTVLGAEEPFGSISGRAFCDANDNAVDDAGDTAVVQQTVVLLNPDGTAVLDTFGDPILAFTETDGTYTFDPIPVGDYRVGFEVLGSKEFVAQGADVDGDGRSDDPAASDVDGTSTTDVSLGLVTITVSTTDVFTVNPGEDVRDVDAGLFIPNQAPDALDDTVSTLETDPVFIDLLANDSDPDLDPLTIIAADGQEMMNGFVTFTATSTEGRMGEVLVSETGSLNFAFDPNGGFDELNDGETDTVIVSYTISDGNGLTDTADVVVTIEGVGTSTATVSGSVIKKGIGDRHVAVILDTSAEPVGTAAAIPVADFDGDGNIGTVADLMLKKVSDMALGLADTDLITLIPSGLGLPDTGTSYSFNAKVLKDAIEADEGTGGITTQQALFSPVRSAYDPIDFTVDLEQAFTIANSRFDATSGFEQNKVIAMVATEPTLPGQGSEPEFIGDVEGAFADLTDAKTNADVDILVTPSGGFIDAANLSGIDSDGTVDVDTLQTFGLENFIEDAPIVFGDADVVSFEISINGVIDANIDIGDLTPTADGFDFAPTELAEGVLDATIGLDTNGDGSADLFRSLSDALPDDVDRTLVEGDSFEFELDGFFANPISAGG